jgi:hypothetical protein
MAGKELFLAYSFFIPAYFDHDDASFQLKVHPEPAPEFAIRLDACYISYK